VPPTSTPELDHSAAVVPAETGTAEAAPAAPGTLAATGSTGDAARATLALSLVAGGLSAVVLAATRHRRASHR
jgi:hypothetical protein